jgi:hypothetical protein
MESGSLIGGSLHLCATCPRASRSTPALGGGSDAGLIAASDGHGFRRDGRPLSTVCCSCMTGVAGSGGPPSQEEEPAPPEGAGGLAT